MNNSVIARVRAFELALREQNLAHSPRLLSHESRRFLASESHEPTEILEAVEMWAQPTLPWSIGRVKLERETAQVCIVGSDGTRIPIDLVWEGGDWRIDMTKDIQAWRNIFRTISDMENKTPSLGERPGAGVR